MNILGLEASGELASMQSHSLPVEAEATSICALGTVSLASPLRGVPYQQDTPIAAPRGLRAMELAGIADARATAQALGSTSLCLGVSDDGVLQIALRDAALDVAGAQRTAQALFAQSRELGFAPECVRLYINGARLGDERSPGPSTHRASAPPARKTNSQPTRPDQQEPLHGH